MFDTLGSIVHRHRFVVLALAAIFLLASGASIVRGGTLTSGRISGLEAERAQALVEEVLGHPADTTFVALLHSDKVDLGAEDDRALVREAVAPLRADRRVLSVVTAEDAPVFRAPGLVNAHAHATVVLVTLKGDFKEALAAYPDVRRSLEGRRLTVTCTDIYPSFTISTKPSSTISAEPSSLLYRWRSSRCCSCFARRWRRPCRLAWGRSPSSGALR